MSHTIRRRKSHTPWHRGRDSNLAEKPDLARQRRMTPTKEERELLVTDHAVLRWLERVTGIDVAAQVRDEILAEGRSDLIRTVGKGNIRVAGSNVVLRIRDGRVITVVVEGSGDG